MKRVTGLIMLVWGHSGAVAIAFGHDNLVLVIVSAVAVGLGARLYVPDPS